MIPTQNQHKSHSQETLIGPYTLKLQSFYYRFAIGKFNVKDCTVLISLGSKNNILIYNMTIIEMLKSIKKGDKVIAIQSDMNYEGVLIKTPLIKSLTAFDASRVTTSWFHVFLVYAKDSPVLSSQAPPEVLKSRLINLSIEPPSVSILIDA